MNALLYSVLWRITGAVSAYLVEDVEDSAEAVAFPATGWAVVCAFLYTALKSPDLGAQVAAVFMAMLMGVFTLTATLGSLCYAEPRLFRFLTGEWSA